MNGTKYHLLIADDEYWSREKLKNMITWEKYNIDFWEPVADGEEVLECLKEKIPDILITDINMPIINGVELMEQIKEKYPSIISFIVSGYSDFEYVKSTLKAGAINYLLKPITKVDLIQAVSEALEMIDERRNEEKEKQYLDTELKRASSFMQDQEYSRLINKKDMVSNTNLSMNINLDSAGYGFILIKIHSMAKAFQRFSQDINQASYAVKKKIKEIMKEDNLIVFNHTAKSNEFIVISKKEGESSHKTALTLIDALEEIFCSPITVVLNGYNYSIDSMHKAYTEAIALLMIRRYRKKSEVICQNSQSKTLQKEKQISFWQEETANQLKALIKSGNKKMLKEIIYKNFDKKECERATYLDVKQAMQQINHLLTAHCYKKMSANEMIALENMADEVDKCVESLDSGLLMKYEEALIEHIMSKQEPEENDSMKSIVKQVKRFIDENYFEPISLTLLSEKFLADSSYLSKSFKQYTGENLSLYAAKKRMERATVLIQEDKISLSEISFIVGYDDYTYFSRVFKKIIGKSPREYKNQNRG